jgi:hypothetical protein
MQRDKKCFPAGPFQITVATIFDEMLFEIDLLQRQEKKTLQALNKLYAELKRSA